MTKRIVVSPFFPAAQALRGFSFEAFRDAPGAAVARSRSSETRAVRIAGVALHVKHYRYSRRQSFRGMLRNTFLLPSRVAREFRALAAVVERAGPDFVPRPAAFGERRSFGFLREAFLATASIEDARPVGPGADPASIGRFLGAVHESGVAHGRLYARNLLTLPDGSLRLVDLDRARISAGPVPEALAARDLACLLVSLPGLDGEELLAAYPGREIDGAVRAAMAEARAGLDRRSGPPHV